MKPLSLSLSEGVRRLFGASRRRCSSHLSAPHWCRRPSAFERLEDRTLLSVGDVLGSIEAPVSFETLEQSMWGPDGPSVVDTGTVFFGPEWDAAVNAILADEGPLDIFVAMDAATSGRVGLDFSARLDPGSVDASFAGLASLQAVRGEGDLFTIHSELPGGPSGSLMTRSPNVDLESNFIFELDVFFGIQAEIATSNTTITVPTVTWTQSCTNVPFVGQVCVPVPNFGTKQVTIPGTELVSIDETRLNVSIAESKNLLKLTTDPANPELNILGIDLVEAKPDGNLAVTFDLVFDPASTPQTQVNVIDDDNPKKDNKPHVTELVDVSVAFSMGDLTLEAATLFLEEDTFSNGALSASGAANLARFAIDADFLASVLFPAVPPLGATFDISVAGFDLFSVTSDLIDVDVGPLFSVGQDFEFVPELWVELGFDKPVTIDGQETTTHQMPVGSSVDASFAGATTGTTLDVASTYFIENTFTNATKLLVAPFVETKVLGLSIDTFLGSLFDEALFRAETLLFDPVPIATIFEDTYSLAGFGTNPGQTLNLVFNRPPEAEDDFATTVEDQPVLINVLANDSDPDGDPLTIESTTDPANGTVQIVDKGTADPSDDEILYTPNLGFHGIDTFEYTINDGRGLTDTATVTVDVLNLVDLGGVVFNDLNNDGVFQPAAGEVGIAGVSVQLFDQSDDTLIATETTAEDGSYFLDVNLGAGIYKIVRSLPAGFLDGDDTAGSTDGGLTTNGIANAALPAITDIVVGEPGTTGDGDGYNFALILPSSIQGLVWEDFDNDGEVDFGEFAIENVAISLGGTDDRGNSVSRSQNTDEQGIFEFVDLRPGTYTIAQTQPDGFIDGKDVVGEVNGVLTGDNDGGDPALSTSNDVFTNVVLAAPGSTGANYNFGERVDGGTLSSGQTATIGFWQNKQGRRLIASLNGSPDSTLLAQYLSDTFPNMYGIMGDANGDGTADDPMTNVEVADLYKHLFKRNAKTSPGGPPKLDAQVLAVALATYLTKQSFVVVDFATGLEDVNLVSRIESFGFDVTLGGVGSTFVNVGMSGAAFNVADNADVQIIDLLLATDAMSFDGLLYDLDGDGEISEATVDGELIDEELLRVLANDVYSAINEA